jgi:hypothetical protein
MAKKGYTDEEAIENYMLIDIDSSFSNQINEWIEAAEKIVDQETGRDFTPIAEGAVAEERLFDGNGLDTLRLPPFKDVEAVKLYGATSTEIDADQYITYPAVGTQKDRVVLKYLKFPQGKQNIAITAVWGYVDVPKDIKLATTVIVAGIINEAWESSSEISSLSIGAYSVSYKTREQLNDFHKIQDIFDRNRRYTF